MDQLDLIIMWISFRAYDFKTEDIFNFLDLLLNHLKENKLRILELEFEIIVSLIFYRLGSADIV